MKVPLLDLRAQYATIRDEVREEFDRILEANGGYSNAYTSHDVTAYYEDFASDVLELIIDLDTDRLRSLALDPQYLESEMGVVKEERRLSIENSIRGQMREELFALAYKAHPYRWPVLGWMSDLEKIDRDDCEIDLKELFKELKKLGPTVFIEVVEDDETVKVWFE